MTKVYCDGSTKLICFIIEGQKPVVAPAREHLPCTNNEGEYFAVLKALDEAKRQGIKDVEILSDSELIINQLTL